MSDRLVQICHRRKPIMRSYAEVAEWSDWPTACPSRYAHAPIHQIRALFQDMCRGVWWRHPLCIPSLAMSTNQITMCQWRHCHRSDKESDLTTVSHLKVWRHYIPYNQWTAYTSNISYSSRTKFPIYPKSDKSLTLSLFVIFEWYTTSITASYLGAQWDMQMSPRLCT